MKLLGILFATFISASITYAEVSSSYRQTLAITSFIFPKSSISSGDDIDQSPTQYWLEATNRNGFGVAFYCGPDFGLCNSVEAELYQTLKKRSNLLDVETRETFLTNIKQGTSERSCAYRYQHQTTLSSGRKIELIESSSIFPCAPPKEALQCPVKYIRMAHRSGWSYCVWTGTGSALHGVSDRTKAIDKLSVQDSYE
jgi:hypothetical protein